MMPRRGQEVQFETRSHSNVGDLFRHPPSVDQKPQPPASTRVPKRKSEVQLCPEAGTHGGQRACEDVQQQAQHCQAAARVASISDGVCGRGGVSVGGGLRRDG